MTIRKSKPRKAVQRQAKRGPKPETLKLDGSWKDAVSHALTRGKPPAGPAKRKARPKQKGS